MNPSNTQAIINLNILKQNIKKIKTLLNQKTKYLLPVKANAYGHGLIEISQYAQKENLVDYLGVATVNEGITLRQKNITLSILIMGYTWSEYASYIVKYNLEPIVCESNLLTAISQESQKQKKQTSIHVKVDTGMGRNGVNLSDALDLIEKTAQTKNINLKGIMSHFAMADDPNNDFTNIQLNNFFNLKQKILTKNIKPELFHIANSGGTLYFPKSRLDMVRPGIATYGYFKIEKKMIEEFATRGLTPLLQTQDLSSLDIKPILELKGKVCFIKKVLENQTIGYNRTYKVKKNTKVAIIPTGYGDGLNRLLSNKGQVIIKNKKYPIIGNISMDQITVDLGKDTKIEIGDEVIFIGKNQSADDIAKIIGTISYEVLTQISSRVERVYV